MFFLAFFLDFFEIAFIIVPLLAPVAAEDGHRPDLARRADRRSTCRPRFMHPPFGFALFYLRSVAPKEVPTSDIYRGAIPFVLIQLAMVGLVIAFPGMVTGNVHKAAKIDLDTIKIEMPHTGDGSSSAYPGDDAPSPFDSRKP